MDIPSRHSYFIGCSNGGREGMVAGERYPEYFDGIVAGAPAFNLTNAAIAEAWSTVQLATIAPKRADGTPISQRPSLSVISSYWRPLCLTNAMHWTE